MFALSEMQIIMQHVPVDLLEQEGKLLFVLTSYGSLRMDDVRNLLQHDVTVSTDFRAAAESNRSYQLQIDQDKTHQQKEAVAAKMPHIACACLDKSTNEVNPKTSAEIKAFRQQVAKNVEGTPCILTTCPFEAVRQYRAKLRSEFTGNIFESDQVFVIKVVKSKSVAGGGGYSFSRSFEVVGKNTISAKLKSFVGQVLENSAESAAASSSSSEIVGYGRGVRRSDFTAHSGRGTAITHAMAGGVSDSNIAVSTGHADVNSMRNYAQPTRESKMSVSLAVARQVGQHQEQDALRRQLAEGDDDKPSSGAGALGSKGTRARKRVVYEDDEEPAEEEDAAGDEPSASKKSKHAVPEVHSKVFGGSIFNFNIYNSS